MDTSMVEQVYELPLEVAQARSSVSRLRVWAAHLAHRADDGDAGRALTVAEATLAAAEKALEAAGAVLAPLGAAADAAVWGEHALPSEGER